MGQVTVGIDIGTTSVKAVAADADGTIVARARVPHEVHVPRPQRLEHDAAVAWRDGPREALRQLGVDAPAGVAVAAMVPSLTAVDADGTPISRGLLYGDERGASLDVAAPPGENGEGAGFLDHLAHEVPDAAGYWPAQAVANHALGGEAVVDLGAGMTLAPLYGLEGWDEDELARRGATLEQMPRVGGLADAVTELPGGTVLASGLVDALGEQLTSGAVSPGDVLVMNGTTLLTWVVAADEHRVEGLWTTPHLAMPDGGFLVGGPSNAGGMFLDWVDGMLAPGELEPDDPAAVPVWTPYLRGERTPLHDPALRGGLHDLALTHGPAALRRAAFEAAGFVVRHHIERSGLETTRIVATGGGTRSGAWMQALADCTGLPVDVAAVPEGAALGAAFCARVAAGLDSDLADARRWARTDRRVQPRPRWHRAAATRYDRFRALTAAAADRAPLP